ncbi:MAG TPA: peptidase S8, partial [Thioalkalivibrio sp.]|nr:peptidase S8 [Thioalkalivibrio sp.]
GVSWGARVMPIRVLGKGGGTSYDIMQGNYFAAGLPNDSDTLPATAADIINLSLGCQDCYSQTEQDAYSAIREAGVIIVAAAGNANTSVPGYPAAYEGVVSVSAVDYQKQRAPYSNFGPTIDVAAPGGNMAVDLSGDGYPDGVLSTRADDSSGSRLPIYDFQQGTSMAAPHMAGVVALMKSVNPGAVTPAALDTWLQSGAITEDLGAAGRDDLYGHGLIDAAKAVQTVQAASGVPPTILTVSPNTLDFGSVQTELALTLGQSGDGTVVVTNVSTTAPWLAIIPPTELGEYSITADRTGLAFGIYTTNLAIAYTVDGDLREVAVPVTLTVSDGGASGTEGDTGYTWIILVNVDTLSTAAQTSVANVNGTYSYRITGVPNGEYYVLAGTDSDNDGFICDAGESCGGYPTLGLLQRVVVNNGDVGNIDFGLTFPSEVTSSALHDAAGRPDGFSKLPATEAPAEKHVEGVNR